MKLTMIATTDIGTLITRKPNIRGGRPILAGTGVTVRRIVVYYKMGWTPEEIVDNFGHITLAQVYAALAYYHANQDEIEDDLAEEEAEVNQIEKEYLKLSAVLS